MQTASRKKKQHTHTHTHSLTHREHRTPHSRRIRSGRKKLKLLQNFCDYLGGYGYGSGSDSPAYGPWTADCGRWDILAISFPYPANQTKLCLVGNSPRKLKDYLVCLWLWLCFFFPSFFFFWLVGHGEKVKFVSPNSCQWGKRLGVVLVVLRSIARTIVAPTTRTRYAAWQD